MENVVKKNEISQEEVFKVILDNNFELDLILEKLSKYDNREDIQDYLAYFGVEVRICSKCNEFMTQGFILGDGYEYYCSDKCINQVYSQQEQEELFKDADADGDNFWTEWDIEISNCTKEYLNACKEIGFDCSYYDYQWKLLKYVRQQVKFIVEHIKSFSALSNEQVEEVVKNLEVNVPRYFANELGKQLNKDSVQEILNNIICEVNKGANFKESVNNNCKTQKDKNNLIKYIEGMSLNYHCVEEFAEVYNIKKLGFENINELQNFIYMRMWNNTEINNL